MNYLYSDVGALMLLAFDAGLWARVVTRILEVALL